MSAASSQIIDVDDQVSLIPINITHFKELHDVFGQKIASTENERKDYMISQAYLTRQMKNMRGQIFVVKAMRNNRLVSLLQLTHTSEVMIANVWYGRDVTKEEKRSILHGVRYYAEHQEHIEKILFRVGKRDEALKLLLTTSLGATIHTYTLVEKISDGVFLEMNEAIVQVS